MAIQTPNFGTKLNDLQLDFGSALAEATFKTMGQDINYLIDSVPVGAIVAFAVNLTGVSIPNANLYQLCDGSEIVHPDSPLRTIGLSVKFTPDLRNRFLYGSDAAGQNAFGGSATTPVDFGDPGSGSTGGLDPNSGGDPVTAGPWSNPHDHNFGTIDNIPPYYTVAYYLKIN